MRGRPAIVGAFVILYGLLVWRNAVNLKPAEAPSSQSPKQHATNHLASTSLLLDASVGKEPLVELLSNAGVELNASIVDQLPTWEEVVSLYGPKPILYGAKEQCGRFQTEAASNKAQIAPAGTFNTGTNAMAGYLTKNCINPYYKGKRRKFNRTTSSMPWQVPWGKHRFASNRGDEWSKSTNVLPVVMVRDPYTWMISECRNSYALAWPHQPEHCPNLIPNQFDLDRFPHLNGKATVPVRFRLGRPNDIDEIHLNSLADAWNEWNRQYFDLAEIPRIMVRFEDLIFRPKELIEAVCACGGGIPATSTFQYHAGGFKVGAIAGHHDSNTTLLTAMIRYGRERHRRTGFTPDDLHFMAEALDREMMHAFGYRSVD